MGCNSTASGPRSSGFPLGLLPTRPLSFAEEYHLGLRSQFFQVAKGPRTLRQLGHFAVRILKVTEVHRLRRTDFHAGGNIVTNCQRAVFGASLLPGSQQPVVAERAFFHHTPRPPR